VLVGLALVIWQVRCSDRLLLGPSGLAPRHFRCLHARDVAIEAKAFSIGLRSRIPRWSTRSLGGLRGPSSLAAARVQLVITAAMDEVSTSDVPRGLGGGPRSERPVVTTDESIHAMRRNATRLVGGLGSSDWLIRAIGPGDPGRGGVPRHWEPGLRGSRQVTANAGPLPRVGCDFLGKQTP